MEDKQKWCDYVAGAVRNNIGVVPVVTCEDSKDHPGCVEFTAGVMTEQSFIALDMSRIGPVPVTAMNDELSFQLFAHIKDRLYKHMRELAIKKGTKFTKLWATKYMGSSVYNQNLWYKFLEGVKW